MTHAAITISVIIPAFNAEQSIESAILSVLNQEVVPSEIIVVNDGSTDATLDIVNQIAAKNRIVRLINQPNAGPARARNHGVSECRSQYITFLDADDSWYPNHIKNLVNIMKMHDGLAWASTAFEYDYGKTIIPEIYRKPLEDGTISNYLKSSRKAVTIHTNTIMLAKKVFEKFNGFREDWRISEDSDLWYRIGIDHPRLGYSKKVSAKYRIREGSISSTRRERLSSVDYFLRSIDTAISYAQEKGVLSRDDVRIYINNRINVAMKACLIEQNRIKYKAIINRYRERGFRTRIAWPTRAYWLVTLWPGNARTVILWVKAWMRR